MQKTLILLLALLCSPFMQAQNLKIEGVQKDCEENRIEYSDSYDIRVNRDGVVLPIEVELTDGKFSLTNLEEGSYAIEYDNIFEQRVQQNVVFDAQTAEVELCVDAFKETNEKTFIEALEEKDGITLKFASTGCFHHKEESMTFLFAGGRKVASFHVDGKKEQLKYLTDGDLQYLISFERQLRVMADLEGGCTTTDYYGLYFVSIKGNQELSISDGTCDWNGFYHVKKAIFGL